jgi:hypothetical protein
VAAEAKGLCLAGALLVTALAAGCGGSSSGSVGTTTASATTGPGNARTAFAAYSTCLAQHGVKLPQGGFRRRPGGNAGPPPTGTNAGTGRRAGGFLPAGVSRATFQKAQQACASKRPQGGFGGGNAPSASALAAFRSCLSSHGVKLPSGSRGFQGLDRSDPKVDRALQTCSVLLPRRTGQGTAS